jgi:hypothetical protein
MGQTKKCSKCKIEKILDENFYFSIKENRYKSACNDCENKRKSKLRRDNIEKYRDIERRSKKKHYERNKPRIKRYLDRTKKIRKERAAKWFQKNKDKVREKRNAYARKRRAGSLEIRLKDNMRRRFNSFIKGGRKKMISYVGLTLDELKVYLESKFYPNPKTGEDMSWDNYGYYGWHIDHIIPLSKFDFNNDGDAKKAFHYTNLQPLWAKDNFEKGDRI